MKLLLIEDEKELAISIRNYLTGKLFFCEWADNAMAATGKISISGHGTGLGLSIEKNSRRE